jgi:hypothetical protein
MKTNLVFLFNFAKLSSNFTRIRIRTGSESTNNQCVSETLLQISTIDPWPMQSRLQMKSSTVLPISIPVLQKGRRNTNAFKHSAPVLVLLIRTVNKCILTKEMMAARSRILTRRSSNCSRISSHNDLPSTAGSSVHKKKNRIWSHEDTSNGTGI